MNRLPGKFGFWVASWALCGRSQWWVLDVYLGVSLSGGPAFLHRESCDSLVNGRLLSLPPSLPDQLLLRYIVHAAALEVM